MKKALLLMLPIILLTSCMQKHNDYNYESDGFGGLQWGSKKPIMMGFTKVDSDRYDYVREGLTFEGEKVSKIRFYWFEKKFAGVNIYYPDANSFERLAEKTTAKYGQGESPMPSGGMRKWKTDKVLIILGSPGSGDGLLQISSNTYDMP